MVQKKMSLEEARDFLEGVVNGGDDCKIQAARGGQCDSGCLFSVDETRCGLRQVKNALAYHLNHKGENTRQPSDAPIVTAPEGTGKPVDVDPLLVMREIAHEVIALKAAALQTSLKIVNIEDAAAKTAERVDHQHQYITDTRSDVAKLSSDIVNVEGKIESQGSLVSAVNNACYNLSKKVDDLDSAMLKHYHEVEPITKRASF